MEPIIQIPSPFSKTIQGRMQKPEAGALWVLYVHVSF